GWNWSAAPGSSAVLRFSVLVGILMLGIVLMDAPISARAADVEITLSNDSCCNMLTAATSPAGQNTGTDMLKDHPPLKPGEQIPVPFDNGQCSWDARATFD